MTSTVINVDLFEQTYRSGLLFSLFEGLRQGESFRIVSKETLEDIKREFVAAHVENLKLEQKESSKGLCEVEIKKVADHKVGCCGMCGG